MPASLMQQQEMKTYPALMEIQKSFRQTQQQRKLLMSEKNGTKMTFEVARMIVQGSSVANVSAALTENKD